MSADSVRVAQWNEWTRARERRYVEGVPEPSPIAAAIRAGVERGDPLALRNLLTMGEQIETGECERGPDFAPSPARAVEPVAVDGTRLAAGEHGEHTLSAGEDSTAVEHTRQSRLSRWQTLGSQR